MNTQGWCNPTHQDEAQEFRALLSKTKVYLSCRSSGPGVQGWEQAQAELPWNPEQLPGLFCVPPQSISNLSLPFPTHIWDN